jgi:hypothetical protein
MKATHIQEPQLRQGKPGLEGYIHISYDRSLTLGRNDTSVTRHLCGVRSSILTYGLHTATARVQLFDIL